MALLNASFVLTHRNRTIVQNENIDIWLKLVGLYYTMLMFLINIRLMLLNVLLMLLIVLCFPLLIISHLMKCYLAPNLIFIFYIFLVLYVILGSNPYSKSKLAPHSYRCVFLRYNKVHKVYKCLNLTTSHLYISRHIVFDE